MRRASPFELAEPAEPLLQEIKGQHDQRANLKFEAGMRDEWLWIRG